MAVVGLVHLLMHLLEYLGMLDLGLTGWGEQMDILH